MFAYQKVGFIGAGNMAQAIIKGLIESKAMNPEKIFVTNRSAGKLQKIAEMYGVVALPNNEALVEKCDIVVLAVKPLDLAAALEPLSSIFNKGQIVVSLAAGVTLARIQKTLPSCRVVRAMPNTPSLIRRGVIGYCTEKPDQGIEAMVEDLLSPLGYVLKLTEGETFEALTVSCAAGTGFIFELMQYWQEWIEERGFEPQEARKMTVETFLGAALLASQSENTPIADLQAKVTSKKGVTEAGLESMRELEIERALRYSFEKAALRDQELARQTQG